MANFINPFANSTDILGDLKKTQDELQEKKKNEDSVTVGNSPDCDFTSIQEAIDFVKEGCVINIKNGTYTETLTVNKKLSFIGEKKGRVIVQQLQNVTCKVFKDSIFKNIVFKNTDTSPSNGIYLDTEDEALVICETNANFENCDFLNSCSKGLLIDKQIQIALKNCKIWNINSNGIYVSNNSSLSIKDCEISETGDDGLVVNNKSAVYIINSKIHDINGRGIQCLSSSKITADSCEIWHTEAFAINCQNENSQMTITNCRIHDCKKGGVCCKDSAKFFADSCEIWNTVKLPNTREDDAKFFSNIVELKSSAAEVSCVKSELILTKCSIHNSPTGIICISSNVTVESCEIWNINYCGITSNSSELTAKKCNIHDIKGRCGILCKDSSTVNVTECTFNSMSIGIKIEKKCKYHLSNNTFTKDVKTKIENLILIFFNDIEVYSFLGVIFGSFDGIVFDSYYIYLVIKKEIKFSIIVFIGIILGGIVFGFIESCNLLLKDKILDSINIKKIQKGSKTIKEDGFIQWFLELIIYIVIWGLMGLLMIFLFPNTTVLGDLGDNIILGICCCFFGISGPIIHAFSSRS